MKQNLHPTYYADAKVICACGHTFTTGSTEKEIHTEICSNCHPFYTGKQRLLDTQGNVDKFKKKKELAAKIKSEAKPKKERKARAKK